MADHLDTMDHAELASKTRELLAAAEYSIRNNFASAGLEDAVKAFQPSPLDKLRQTLREQGWRQSEMRNSTFVAYLDGNERWIHDA